MQAKRTLCDVVSGKTRPTTGSVFFDSADITQQTEAEIALRGIGRKFQTPTVFDSLTTYENMELALPGHYRLWSNLFGPTTKAQRERIIEILERVGLADELHREAKYLSHGQRQWLAISTLILSDPKLLLVDEPAAGLTDTETALTAELLLELKEDHTLIVIEHDMDFVRQLDSFVTVLNEGVIMAEGMMHEVQQNEEVIEAYLGEMNGKSSFLFNIMLTVSNLSFSYGEVQVLRGVDLHVPAETIVSMMGRNGVGKTTLMNNIVGVAQTIGRFDSD